MSDCTFTEVLQAWHKGFEGYYFDMTMEIEQFLKKVVSEDLAPEHSWIVFSEGSPAGLLLNGFRTVKGKKRAWNGGTGVALDLRGTGVGKRLMEKMLQTYKLQGVDECYLEAISDNSTAISLYKKVGYEVVDKLVFLQNKESLDEFTFTTPKSYRVEQAPVQKAANLDFYDAESSWQTLAQNVKDGQAAIAYDVEKNIAGYALFSKHYTDSGELARIVLYQCKAQPDLLDEHEILNSILKFVFEPGHTKCLRSTVNTSKKSTALIAILKQAGFAPAIEQVHMKKTMI